MLGRTSEGLTVCGILRG